MKKIAFLFYLMSCFQMANAAELPDDVVDSYLKNPVRYFFDDGGNIDFGNGFFLRRIKPNGQPQVCHRNNIMYAAERTKCLVTVSKRVCKEYQTYIPRKKMVGERYFCRSRGHHFIVDELNPNDPRCERYSTIPFNYGPDVKVKIYRTAKMNGKKPGGYLGHAYLTIPRCDD